MAGKRSFRPRKGSKPSMAKAKKMVAKSKAKKARKGMDTFFQRCRTETTLVPTQGGFVSNYIYNYWSLVGQGANTLYDNAQFQQNAMIYDKYRVNRVRITVTPKANVLDAYLAQDDANLTLTGSGVVHTCLDRDGAGPSSVSQMVQRASYRKYSLLKKFSRSYSIKYPTNTWFDCTGDRSGPNNQSQVVQTLGCNGGVTIYAENLLEDASEIINEPWAECVIEWDVVFQGRIPPKTSFQLDEAGNVIGYTITPNDPLEAKTQSLSVSKNGTIQDTRLTDTVATNNEMDITHGEDQ